MSVERSRRGVGWALGIGLLILGNLSGAAPPAEPTATQPAEPSAEPSAEPQPELTPEIPSAESPPATPPATPDANYADLEREMYQALAKRLIEEGEVERAQQVLQLLKERDLADEVSSAATRGAESEADAGPTIQGLANLDRNAFARFYVLRDQQTAIGRERSALENKQRAGRITAAESARLDAITTRLFPEINGPLSRFFPALQEQLSRERLPGHVVVDLETAGTRMRSAVMEADRSAPASHAVGLQYLWAGGDLTLILVTAGAPPLVRQVPIEREVYRARIHAARELLRHPQSDPNRLEAALESLRGLLITPIEADLRAAGAHTLMILPDDDLRVVPFAALTDGKRYLVQDYALAVFSDAVYKIGPASASWKVAGMGATQAVEGFPALPAVIDELGDILRQPGISGASYLDAQFNHDRLTRTLGGDFNVLHIASHFILQPGKPDASRLYLGDRSQLTVANVREQDLRFENFDLVTFSACETGLTGGPDSDGRELEGLAARVQSQGAHAVMASLWKVYDASTAEFMQAFYRAHGEGKMNKAESLRAAQVAFIEGTGSAPRAAPFKSPYYWAPFVLMGNWQ